MASGSTIDDGGAILIPPSPVQETGSDTVPAWQTLDEARRRLATAVDQVSGQLGALVRRVEWTADRNRVKLEGVGFSAELWVDPQTVHATGDVPLLGALLGRSLGPELTHILQQTFRKQLS
jgi:hypothetical protein